MALTTASIRRTNLSCRGAFRRLDLLAAPPMTLAVKTMSLKVIVSDNFTNLSVGGESGDNGDGGESGDSGDPWSSAARAFRAWNEKALDESALSRAFIPQPPSRSSCSNG